MPPSDAAGNFLLKPTRYVKLLLTLFSLASVIVGVLIGGGGMLVRHGRELEVQDRDRQMLHSLVGVVNQVAVTVDKIAELQREDHPHVVELWEVHRRGGSRTQTP